MAMLLGRWLSSYKDHQLHTLKALHIDCLSTREYTWYVLSSYLSVANLWNLTSSIDNRGVLCSKADPIG